MAIQDRQDRLGPVQVRRSDDGHAVVEEYPELEECRPRVVEEWWREAHGRRAKREREGDDQGEEREDELKAFFYQLQVYHFLLSLKATSYGAFHTRALLI